MRALCSSRPRPRRRMTTYKAEAAGVHVVIADRFEPSSKTCRVQSEAHRHSGTQGERTVRLCVRDGDGQRITEGGCSFGEAYAVFLQVGVGLLGIPVKTKHSIPPRLSLPETRSAVPLGALGLPWPVIAVPYLSGMTTGTSSRPARRCLSWPRLHGIPWVIEWCFLPPCPFVDEPLTHPPCPSASSPPSSNTTTGC